MSEPWRFARQGYFCCKAPLWQNVWVIYEMSRWGKIEETKEGKESFLINKGSSWCAGWKLRFLLNIPPHLTFSIQDLLAIQNKADTQHSAKEEADFCIHDMFDYRKTASQRQVTADACMPTWKDKKRREGVGVNQSVKSCRFLQKCCGETLWKPAALDSSCPAWNNRLNQGASWGLLQENQMRITMSNCSGNK